MRAPAAGPPAADPRGRAAPYRTPDLRRPPRRPVPPGLTPPPSAGRNQAAGSTTPPRGLAGAGRPSTRPGAACSRPPPAQPRGRPLPPRTGLGSYLHSGFRLPGKAVRGSQAAGSAALETSSALQPSDFVPRAAGRRDLNFPVTPRPDWLV